MGSSPLPLFNPPCPHADPVNAGPQQIGQRCGNCVSVPRWWLLTCGAVSGVYSAMGGRFVLSRDLAAFRTDATQFCRWQTRVNLFPNQPPPIVNGIWSLTYQSGLGYWQVWADMSANLPADIDVWGPNAVAANQAVTGWVPTNWNCLGPNIMQASAGGLGFPFTIQIEPFWP